MTAATDKLKTRAVRHSRGGDQQPLAAGEDDAPMYYSGPGSSSSLDLTTRSQPHVTTTLSTAVSQQQQQEAPYLTHAVRNAHGQVTLVPPDNLGRQRSPGTVDQHTKPNKVVKKKPKKPKKSTSTRPDAAILEAVFNAGRKSTPTSPSATATDWQHGSSSTSSTTANLGIGTSQQQQQQHQQQQQQPRSTTTSMARSPSQQSARASITSSSMATTSSRTEPAPISPPPSSVPLVQVSQAHDEAYPFPDMNQLDSHASLVPSSTMMDSPPPAYPAQQQSSSTATVDNDQTRVPSLLDLDQTPTAAQPGAELTGDQLQIEPASSSSPQSTDDQQPDQSTGFTVELPILSPPLPPSLFSPSLSSSNPFNVAWEQDRLAGLPLDVRIGRDLARRKAAEASNVISVSTSHVASDNDMSQLTQDLSSLDLTNQNLDVSSSSVDQTGLNGPSAVATLSTSTEETMNDNVRVARALSVYAGRKIALAAERRRALEAQQRQRQIESTGVIDEGQEQQEGDDDHVVVRDSVLSTTNQALSDQPAIQSSTIVRPQVVEEGNEEEEEEQEEEEEERSEPEMLENDAAQSVPTEAHRQFAEAAERRIAALKATADDRRAQTVATVVTSSGDNTETHPRRADDTRSATVPSTTAPILDKPSTQPMRATSLSTARQSTIDDPTTLDDSDIAQNDLLVAATRSETPPPLPAPIHPILSTPIRQIQSSESARSSLTRSPALADIASFALSPGASSHAGPEIPLSLRPAVSMYDQHETIRQQHGVPRPISVEEQMMPLRWQPPLPSMPDLPPSPSSSQHPNVAQRRLPPPVPPPRSSTLPSQVQQAIPRTGHHPMFSASDPALLNNRIPQSAQSFLQPPLVRGDGNAASSFSFSSSSSPPSSNFAYTATAHLQRRPSVKRRPAPPPPPGSNHSSSMPSRYSSSTSGTFDDSSRRRPLPIPPSSSNTRLNSLEARNPSSSTYHGYIHDHQSDAFESLRRQVHAHDVARQRQEALSRLEGGHHALSQTTFAPDQRYRIGQDQNQELQSGSYWYGNARERPRSIASSVDEEGEEEEGPEEPTRQFGVQPNSSASGVVVDQQQQERTSETPSFTGTPVIDDNVSHGVNQTTLTSTQQQDELGQFTELDLLLARLERDQATVSGTNGDNYEDLNLLGEVLGPAKPPGASPEELETLAVARVECERRRVDKHGKVKVKLSVVGVRCTDCGICLSRFKVDDLAVVLPNCLHAFHESCITSWFARNRQCPFCRAEVFESMASASPNPSDREVIA
ncbi:hypothetical protein OIO90_005836 [Microbotryomycetes sp. JL221]|nr:hypothetical protein OIO90_005836 [Microbotryomycetes sp. JL221]